MNRSTSLAAIAVTAIAGLAMLLGMSTLTASQDESPRPQKAPAAAAAPEMTIRGPNDAVVGRRFTLEIIIANPTGQAMKDLEFTAELDGNLVQESKARAHLEKIASIAAENLHIVRIAVTPTKKGPARVDIILRTKDGQMQQVQQVIPVFAADDAPAQPDRPAGSSPLTVTITSPKDTFADRSAMFLIHVHNTGAQATAENMELIVAYGTLGNNVQIQNDFRFNPGMREDRGPRGGRVAIAQANPTNPVRETRINLPSLTPNESRTVPVMLTARRIGDFRVAVTSGNQMIGSTGVQARFDPNASIESLLPKVAVTPFTPRLPRTLADVTEVGLEDRYSKSMKADEAFEQIAHMMDKVNFANAKKLDAFVAGLAQMRPDMAGMPLAMGDKCRLPLERAGLFLGELTQLRAAMAQAPNGNGLASKLPNNPNEKASSARIAAMMQVLGPESAHMRTEMVSYLSKVATAESTQSLAKLAVFSEEEQVRQSALDVLKTRNEKDYSDVLVRGLNYPWPAVAQNAGNAIVKLNRKDLIPQLVATLERPDPRAPEARADGKQVVHEMVKVNHLRNCMLCHPPRSADQNPAAMLNGGISGGIPGNGSAVLLAQVPIPNQALPVSPGNGGGYGSFSVPDTLIRFDITYLRQDFSVMLPVADHQPWPQTQRFDFLIRTREITEKDAQAYRDLLRPAGAGDLTPYQRAAVSALRGLTGRDAEPTAPAWRRLLEQMQTEAGKS